MIASVLAIGACSTDPSDNEADDRRPGAGVDVECREAEYPPAPVYERADAPAGPVPRFADLTDAAGLAMAARPVCLPPTCLINTQMLAERFSEIDIKHDDATNGAWCQIDRFMGSVAVGDADGDGDPDVFVGRLDGPGRLLRNDGGRFLDVTDESGIGAAEWEPSSGAVWADVDNDGDADLAVNTIAASRLLLYLNDGNGRFEEAAVGRGLVLPDGYAHAGFSIAAGDIDRDGFVDLYATEYIGDVGGDPSARVDGRLFRNRGRDDPASFDDVTNDAGVSMADLGPVSSFGAAITDLDADGWADLWVTGDFGTSRLFWNDGDGTFTEATEAAGVGTDENGMGSAAADLDGDGLLERFVSSIYDERGSSIARGGNWGASGNRLFHNRGERRFADVTDSAGLRDGQWGWGSVFVDTMNRGARDLVQVSGLDLLITDLADIYRAGPTFVWRNDGGLRFSEVGAASGLDVVNGRGLATLDFDADGRVDVLVGMPGGAVELYRNESDDAGRWLRVRVVGEQSGTDALGTVVTLVDGQGRRQVQVVGANSDFLGQSEPVLHFGLGDGGSGIRSVTARFPVSGREVVVRDVALDRTIEIEERSP